MKGQGATRFPTTEEGKTAPAPPCALAGASLRARVAPFPSSVLGRRVESSAIISRHRGKLINLTLLQIRIVRSVICSTLLHFYLQTV